jgi:hypothetical protein
MTEMGYYITPVRVQTTSRERLVASYADSNAETAGLQRRGCIDEPSELLIPKGPDYYNETGGSFAWCWAVGENGRNAIGNVR